MLDGTQFFIFYSVTFSYREKLNLIETKRIYWKDGPNISQYHSRANRILDSPVSSYLIEQNIGISLER